MLELRIAFLAWLVVLAVVIESSDRKPGAGGRGLPCLGVETGSNGIVFGEYCAVALQVVLVGPPRVHPQAQALIPDELHNPDRLVDGSVLCRCPIQLVLIDEHMFVLAFPLSLSLLLFFPSA